ncbi:MAG: PAS domain S-box protein [bacterium]|nr:PAS domain S-box protein [bacterium]
MFYKDEFKKVRKKRKITQKDLAISIGKSLKTLQRWELGLSIPSEYNIRLLADKLKTVVSAISDLENQDELLPHYYSKLGSLDKSIFDFSTKTESQKQQLLVNYQKKIEIASWENNELKNSNELLKSIINSVNTLIYCKNRKMKFTYANHRFLSYFGFSDIESVLGRRSSDIWTGQYKWFELEKLEKRVFENKNAIDNKVVQIPRSFGQIGTGIVSIKPVIDSSGEVGNITSSIIDTTGEQVAKEKSYYTESVLDKLEHVIWIIKKKPYKHYIYVNNAAENLYKINKSEFYINVNKWLDFIHENDKKRIKKEIANNSKELIYRIDIDGIINWVQHYLYSSVIGKEEFEYSIIKDITESKKAQEKMELLEINVSVMVDGLAIVENKTQKYLYLNSAISKITGYSLDLLYKEGHNFWKDNIIETSYKKKLTLKKLTDLRKEIVEYKIIRFDGAVRWIQNIVKVNKVNGLECRIVIVRDITQQKEIEEKISKKIKAAYDKGLKDGKK